MTDFAATRRRFHLPDGLIYLDGNSLGPLPLAAREAARRTLEDEWGSMLIGGWNGAGWMDMPARLGDRIGRLIGAPAGSVMVGDTLSVKVYQALAAALDIAADRPVVLSDTGNFPTDLYMAEGLLASLHRGQRLETVAPEAVIDRIGADVAVVMLTHVDYRTGRMHHMEAITRAAHAAGAVVIWDLAHSAGAVPVDMTACNAEFAVGCTYKYLNGGPGAPAFIHARLDLHDRLKPALAGWLGHAAPFAFEPRYRPGEGMARMRVGTPPVLQMAVLDAALDVWEGVSMDDIRARSIALSEAFRERVESGCDAVALASPRDPAQRGSQVSFRFEDGYAVIQAMIAQGVTGDFRAPDIMRFGFCPLYNTMAEVEQAAAVLCQTIASRRYTDPRFLELKAVT